MGFKPSKADPDIWMRLSKDESVYEYISVYVDDFAIAMKNLAEFCKTVKEKYNFKLKGDGPMEIHLGFSYKQDPDGTLVGDSRRYVENILASYQRMFGEVPKRQEHFESHQIPGI